MLLHQRLLRVRLFLFHHCRARLFHILGRDARHRRHIISLLRLDEMHAFGGASGCLHRFVLDADRLPVGGHDREIVVLLNDARRDDLADLLQCFIVDRGDAAGGASLG